MWYVIVGEDHPNSLDKRLSVREQHVQRLNALKLENRLLLAGPNPAVDNEDPGEAGFTGSIIVAQFESLEAAKQWAGDDPYVSAGVYKNVTIKPFKKVLP
ncbi:MAG: YciI family protein [Gammaproteobacteria bacterium]|jgi:uncharacterized protein YciI